MIDSGNTQSPVAQQDAEIDAIHDEVTVQVGDRVVGSPCAEHLPEIAAIYQRSTAVSCKYQLSVQAPNIHLLFH